MKDKEQFPRWAQPYLGKWWRPVTLEEWAAALRKAGMLKGVEPSQGTTHIPGSEAEEIL